MCGIMGGVAERDIAPILLAGLKHLEYRGYDSAGMAIIGPRGLKRYRALGKVQKLADLLAEQPLHGVTGIAHTRWATHGEPSERNAHPHISGDDIALVHNGIIENHDDLRAQLKQEGYHFDSDTDSEIVAHLLHQQLSQGFDFFNAVHAAIRQLEGAYALVFLYCKEPDHLIAVRRGSPLVVGLGIGENFIASDPLALLPVTRNFVFLEEGDIADVRRDKVQIYDLNLIPVNREIRYSEMNSEMVTRGEFRHFMLKEIYDQPLAVSKTLDNRISSQGLNDTLFGLKLTSTLETIKRVQIVACGTSYHAGLIARFWLESLVKIPTQVEIASEWRYRTPIVEPDTLFVTISQSGETADTLAALRAAKVLGYTATLSICNMAESTLVRESDLNLLTYAGPEIGVASTKAFTTQLINLFLLTLLLGRNRTISPEQNKYLINQLHLLPEQIEQTLNLNTHIQALARGFVDKEHALFLGRGLYFPVALEGALKLKEISYIHAEAYPAGELKHGPLALVDESMPVIAIAPQDEYLEKLKSNLHEVCSRGATLVIFSNKLDASAFLGSQVIHMPNSDPYFSPFLYTIPLQLLAYHVAVLKGTDVDQPRNLAKSVTVE